MTPRSSYTARINRVFVSQWLPDSGYVPDDRTCLEVYPADFTMDEKTGAFSCWLCLPVRAL